MGKRPWLPMSFLALSLAGCHASAGVAARNDVDVISIEAEAPANTLGGGAAVAACTPATNCSGGKRVIAIGSDTGTLTFNGIEGDGSARTVTFYYTNGKSSDEVLIYQLNGGAAVTLSVPPTGSWDTVGSASATIAFAAGANTLTFTRSTDLDRITVSQPTATATPDAGTTSSGQLLPLEVLGADQTTTTATVNVPSGSTAQRLSIRANNLSYDGKASVRCNQGDWVTITNANATLDSAAAIAYGGIGGGYDTISLSVPISGCVDGANTLSFRFNFMSNGISSGYRVLALNLLDSAGKGLVDQSQLAEDDPATWTAPRPSETDAGAQLWHTATLTNGFGEPSAAHCDSCHAYRGIDLKYFNYSNNSIITRAQFHGLSEADGERIASYIRSLAVPNPGRPWQPVYQPGPGLDAQPVANWTAGAGVDAVLENDADTLRDLLPSYDGANPATILAADIPASGHFNARQGRLAFQLPDWNHWLPVVAPEDGYGSEFTSANGPESRSTFDNIRARLQSGGNNYILTHDANGNSYQSDIDNAYFKPFVDSAVIPDGSKDTWTPQQQIVRYSLSLWTLVQMWDFAHEYPIESNCQQAYLNMGADRPEERCWIGNNRFVFDSSPRLSGVCQNTNNPYFSPKQCEYIANAWYEMQEILQFGSHFHAQHNPYDHNYAMGVIGFEPPVTGRPEPGRLFRFEVKALQETDSKVFGVSVDSGRGFAFWIADPSVFSQFVQTWAGFDNTTFVALINAWLEAWLNKAESFPPSTWQRQADYSNDCRWMLCPADWTPDKGNVPSIYYQDALPFFLNAGVRTDLTNRFAKEMKALYPNGDWEKFYR